MVSAVVAVASTTAKSEVIKSVVNKFRTGIAGLFGDTPTDKERKAAAADALGRALNGDSSALSYLLARAGIRADANVKVAPESARRIFRTALRTYYSASGVTPSADIAKALSIGATPTDEVLPMFPTTTSASTPDVSGSSSSWIIPVAIGGIALLLLARGSRR